MQTSGVEIVILSVAKDLAFVLASIPRAMRREHRYYVYILTSSSRRALYTGMTNNIYKPLDQHETDEDEGFAKRYHAFRLVHLEIFRYINNAIAREKEIKGWTRAKKNALISSRNPQWRDLAQDLGQPQDPSLHHPNELRSPGTPLRSG